MKTIWYVIKGVNPQPWAIGPLTVGRKGGKVYPSVGPNAQLKAYQQSVREALASDNVPYVYDGPVRFTFWFQREIEMHYGPSGRKVWANEVDATNLQKGLEDALQNCLIVNDRYVFDIRSVILAQGRGVTPLIVIRMDETDVPDFGYSEIPQEVWNVINEQPKLDFSSNEHNVPEDIF